eukprot:5775137-Alexandrium_andersonii.AAC.1
MACGATGGRCLQVQGRTGLCWPSCRNSSGNMHMPAGEAAEMWDHKGSIAGHAVQSEAGAQSAGA